MSQVRGGATGKDKCPLEQLVKLECMGALPYTKVERCLQKVQQVAAKDRMILAVEKSKAPGRPQTWPAW
jgi:hypothetical protein